MESVLRQTWPELEYLVIDGGSTDGTVEIVREYEKKFISSLVHDCISENADACADQQIRKSGNKARRQFLWVSEPDKGMYDAINKGIRLATGDVVGILNADDVLSDDRVIERVASAFGGSSFVHDCERSEVRESETANGEISRQDAKAQRGSERLGAFAPLREELGGGRTFDERLVVRTQRIEVGSSSTNELTNSRTNELLQAVYGDIRFVSDRRGIGLEEIRAEPTARYYSSRYFRTWLARFGYMPAHPSFYCRRELFEKFGCYHTDYRIAADHELLIRFLVKERIRSAYLPEAMVVMRLGGMSTRSVESTLILNRENIRACRSNGIYTNRLMQLGKYLFKLPGLIFKAGY